MKKIYLLLFIFGIGLADYYVIKEYYSLCIIYFSCSSIIILLFAINRPVFKKCLINILIFNYITINILFLIIKFCSNDYFSILSEFGLIFLLFYNIFLILTLLLIYKIALKSKNKIIHHYEPYLTVSTQEYNYMYNYFKNEVNKLNNLEEHSKKLINIFELSKDLQKEFDIDKFITKFTEKLTDIIEYEKGAVFIFELDDKVCQIRQKYLLNSKEHFIIPINTYIPTLLIHKKIIFTNNYSNEITFDLFENSNTIIIPLLAGEKILGIFTIKKAVNTLLKTKNYFTKEEIAILNAVTYQLSINIHKCLLFNKLNELAINDMLTGLFVHSQIKKILSKEVARAKINNHKLSILMLDIDYFKKFNDNYGHNAGDIVLKNVSSIILNTIRDSDYAGRYGGEEFMAILPNCNKINATKIAQRLNKSIQLNTIKYHGKNLNVTVSIGVSCMPEDAGNENNLIDIADKALYKAKNKGRNQVAVI